MLSLNFDKMYYTKYISKKSSVKDMNEH